MSSTSYHCSPLSAFTTHRQQSEFIYNPSAHHPLSSAPQTQSLCPTPGTPTSNRSYHASAAPSQCSNTRTHTQHTPSNSNDNPDDSDSDSDPENDIPSDPLSLLARAITRLAKSAGCMNSSTFNQRHRVRTPYSFDGSDSSKLCIFLVQCELNFQNRPKAFRSDCAKVTFVQSYLTNMALQWFEPDILFYSSEPHPLWMTSYSAFVTELRENFGPHNPVSDTEHELRLLFMTNEQHIIKYIIEFNHIACQVCDYRDGALRHHFYNGLPDHIKGEISCMDKPHMLTELRTLAQSINTRYWECKSKHECQVVTANITSNIKSTLVPSAPSTSHSDSLSEGPDPIPYDAPDSTSDSPIVTPYDSVSDPDHSPSMLLFPSPTFNPSNLPPFDTSDIYDSNTYDSNPPDDSHDPHDFSDAESLQSSNSANHDPTSDIASETHEVSTDTSELFNLSSMLGPDGKLSNIERQRHLDLHLCFYCGLDGHIARDCSMSSCA